MSGNTGDGPGSNESIRVLHVDDDPEFAEVVRLHLERVDDALEVLTETHAQDGLDRLAADGTIECVVSDLDMPDVDGLEFLRTVRRTDADMPFILFTGKGSEEVASEAIAAGVSEYLQKGTGSEQYDVLAHRIERAVTQRRARQALEESERMFSTLVKNLPGMVYRCRIADGWPMTFVSEGCEALTGYAPADLESGTLSWGADVVHPDDRDILREPIQAGVEPGESLTLTYRIVTKAGETRWVWARSSCVSADGEADVLEGFIADVTDSHRQAAALEREREFTDSVLDTIDDVFYVVEPESGRLVRWNDKATEYTGYSNAEIVEMRFTDFVAPEDVERVQTAAAEALSTGSTVVQATVVPKAGEPFPMEFRGSPMYDTAGELIGIGGIGRDVSDRVDRERDLERYATVMEAVGDPVYALDAEGVFTFVNEAIEPLTGYTPAELRGEHVSVLVGEDGVERGREHIADLLASPDRRAVKYEIDLETKSEETIPSEVHIALLPPDADGDFRGTAGIVRDISARQRREDRLEAFASVVSHDLRNHLHVIDGRAQLAKETDDPAHLDRLRETVDDMEAMIADVLQLARQGETVGETQPVALERAARTAWTAVDTGHGELIVEDVGTVTADPDRLNAVFENLFRNAMEHATDAGDPDGSETVRVLVAETSGGFAVADDGPGIRPADRESVFDRGYASDDGGSGLGLAIVKSVAEGHGWDVRITTSDWGGARIEFTT